MVSTPPAEPPELAVELAVEDPPKPAALPAPAAAIPPPVVAAAPVKAAAPTPAAAPPRPHPTKAKAQLAPSLPPAADGEAAPSIGPASGTQLSEGSADPTAEGSGPRGGTAAASGGVDHAGEDYRALIKQRIQAALVFPAAARRIGLTGQVMVRFLIDAEGRVPEDSLGVVGGAESDLLRDGALRTVKQAMPFPPPPGGGMRLELAVTFNRSS